MGTVRTFCARHWKGMGLALALLGVLTCALAVSSQSTQGPGIPRPTEEPPFEWVYPRDFPKETAEPPLATHSVRSMSLDELRAAFVDKSSVGLVYEEESEPPRRATFELLEFKPVAIGPPRIEMHVSTGVKPPLAVKGKPRSVPTDVVRLPDLPAPPARTDVELLAKINLPPRAPHPPPARMAIKAPPPKTPLKKTASAAPLLVHELQSPPPGDPPFPITPPPGLPSATELDDPAEEQEIRDALAERRFLDLMHHSPEPPLFVEAPGELKRLLELKPSPEASAPRRALAKNVVITTKPDVTKPVDPPAKIRAANAQEVLPTPLQETHQPSGVLPSLMPIPTGNCPTCGKHGLLSHGHGRGRTCTSCGQGQCSPGRTKGYPCESNTLLGGIFCDVYECICCPDPCYDPKWIPQADAAFFVDAARPVSQMKIGWDSGRNFLLPDRSEYFWPRADGSGKGPRPAGGETSLRYDDLVIFTETAVGGFSTIVNFPYRSMSPDRADHASGYTDMTVGTKSLLFDCELIQVSFQFLTIIPTGNFSKGLGTGHLSLEPSLLFALKLSKNTYVQGQLAEWIPLGGDPNYAGAILHTHTSINQVLYRVMPDVPIIGTFELSTWSFQDGAFTDPVLGANQRSGGTTYAALGPGLRVFICDRMDFGAGAQFAVTQQHFAQSVFRAMFRYRF